MRPNRMDKCLSLPSVFQTPDEGLFLTAVDSGLLSALQPAQTLLFLFLSSPDEEPVSGTGVILSYSSAGKESRKLCTLSHETPFCKISHHKPRSILSV